MPFIMSDLEVHDIDSPEDWMIAEQKFEFLKRKAAK
jgi:CMP-N-acetylneuraminic acid synthetase